MEMSRKEQIENAVIKAAGYTEVNGRYENFYKDQIAALAEYLTRNELEYSDDLECGVLGGVCDGVQVWRVVDYSDGMNTTADFAFGDIERWWEEDFNEKSYFYCH